MISSSRPEYHQIVNIQPDHYGNLPNDTTPFGMEVDLTSYSNLANMSDTTIYTAFGYDYPQPDVGPLSFLFIGTGYLNISTSWELLGWGYDTDGIGFRVEYEYQKPFQGYTASINFSSREENRHQFADFGQASDRSRGHIFRLPGAYRVVGKRHSRTYRRRANRSTTSDCGADCIENLALKAVS